MDFFHGGKPHIAQQHENKTTIVVSKYHKRLRGLIHFVVRVLLNNKACVIHPGCGELI